MNISKWRVAMIGLATAAAVPIAGPSWGATLSGWAPAIPVSQLVGSHEDVNTPYLDGCPIQSPDGLSLYMASNRPGGVGKLDIWVAYRDSRTEGWGAPQNLGEPVNSPENDFCPTPLRGGYLMMVSERAGTCGAGDIYIARHNPAHGWSDPQNLGCDVDGGPNSAAGEASPSYVAVGTGSLFFSSNRTGTSDLFVSSGKVQLGFGVAEPIAELNSSVEDARPNVSRNGLEIFFDSNRAGGLGGFDIWSSTRSSLADPWSPPVNLGPAVNTAAANETRASLSWDGTTLLFGRAPGPEGQTDIYITTRQKESAGHE
jgi:hypothetical protein